MSTIVGADAPCPPGSTAYAYPVLFMRGREGKGKSPIFNSVQFTDKAQRTYVMKVNKSNNNSRFRSLRVLVAL